MAISRILVVDDSPTEVYYLSEILIQHGFEVLTASSGADAIDQARKTTPDLIIMDVVMPGINGFQATRELAKDERTLHIPVVFCTTKGEESDREWGRRQGAADYLVKPVEESVLIETIHNLSS